MLIGYQKDLPDWASPGTKVRVKKGATLRSSHPKRPVPYKAVRDQIVTINHVLPGQTLTLGLLWDE